jgi:pimeloyl-ACP methyl ester carboxylesterase
MQSISQTDVGHRVRSTHLETERHVKKIRFEDQGDGTPALVFVHGWSCDRRYWREQLPFFASRYRCVTLDLAGHGDSDTDRTSFSMASFGEDVVEVVDALALDDMVLIGHSMGGDVIVEAALRLKGRVRALIWVDTYRELGEPMTSDDIEAFAEPFRRDFPGTTEKFVREKLFSRDTDPALVAWVARDMASAPPPVALDAMVHSLANETPVIAALPLLKVPVVAINPDYVPTDVGNLAAYGIEVRILAETSHFLMLESPDRFNRLLDEVIRRTR